MTPKSLIIAVVSISILLLLAYMWPFSKTASSPKIVKTKTFSCPGMERFTFEYPVFEGWMPKHTDPDNNSCTIWLNDDYMSASTLTTISAAKIEVSVISAGGGGLPPGNSGVPKMLPSSQSKKNPNSIVYDLNRTDTDNADGLLIFFFPVNNQDVTVYIKLIGISKKNGFNTDLFFQTVIDSFRVVK